MQNSFHFDDFFYRKLKMTSFMKKIRETLFTIKIHRVKLLSFWRIFLEKIQNSNFMKVFFSIIEAKFQSFDFDFWQNCFSPKPRIELKTREILVPRSSGNPLRPSLAISFKFHSTRLANFDTIVKSAAAPEKSGFQNKPQIPSYDKCWMRCETDMKE